MLDHHLQRSIVLKLAYTPSATFSQLKPDDIDNKLFTYHLKKAIAAGYVLKSTSGEYTLTPSGRRLSTGVEDKQQTLIVERPLSALFLVIKRQSDRAWLMYERKTHPMLGYQGFMHVRPNASDTIETIARIQVEAKTGLQGDFTALGGGYIRVFQNDQLESYTHFTLLYCNDIKGELTINDPHANYFWIQDPDFSSKNMFPTTQILKEKYDRAEPFFIEKTYAI